MRALLARGCRAILLTLALIALTSGAGRAQESVAFNLGPVGGSGLSGSVTLTALNGQTRVVVVVANAQGPHPAHIHVGPCDRLNPTPRFPLADVVNGRSETVVNVSLQQILALPPAVVVHRSAREMDVYLVCGGVSAAAANVLIDELAQARGEPPPTPAPTGQGPGVLPPVGEADTFPIVMLTILLAMTGLGLISAGVYIRLQGDPEEATAPHP